MLAATIVMMLIAGILSLYTYMREPTLLAAGLTRGVKLLGQILPLLLAALIVAGLAQVLLPKDIVGKWLGAESGLKGILLGSVAGAVTPGGPYVAFPIVLAIYQAGAGIGTVIAFVTAWSLWAVTRLPIEVGLVGPKVTLVRIASTLIFPPLAGLIAHFLFGRFFR
jgi:uncharacterized membrane protein YraQ (UPF0718 family)